MAGLNEALPAKAAGQKLLRTAQLRADTTVPANVFIRRIPGCWPGRSGGSPREQEVLDLIRIGVLTDREIARALHIAPATAATHVQRILHKTQLHDRRDLMLLPPLKSAA